MYQNVETVLSYHGSRVALEPGSLTQSDRSREYHVIGNPSRIL
jgi:hypothetical protein